MTVKTQKELPLTAVVKLLHQVVNEPSHVCDSADQLKPYPELWLLYCHLVDLRQFIEALSNGDLSLPLDRKGYLAGRLKALQANLRHLTWQTQMIASGDFSQQIDFMGDFSEAFNTMVMQLHGNQNRLQSKQEELTQINQELQTEIELRKQTEACLRQSEELYRKLAAIDPLTGIFNRRHFCQLALPELKRARRYHRSLSIIILDVDHFKQINDSFGHLVGDQVLQALAKLVQASVRTVDLFARYGGEEFILLLPETDLAGGMETADRLRRQVSLTPWEFGRGQINLTVSAGVAALDPSLLPSNPHPAALDHLIGQADQALYDAKNTGRNKVSSIAAPQACVFTPQFRKG